MALGTANITMTAIRDILVEDTLRLSELCLSPNINKWSRYKPVRGAFPQADDGNYGLGLVNNWAYRQPRGRSYSEPYRMGDFRGYEHEVSVAAKCVPPIHVLSSEFANADLYPYGGNHSNFIWVRGYRTEADNQYGILPSMFAANLDNYYFGLRYSNVNGTFYKTYGVVSNLDTDGTPMAIVATLVETTPGAGDWHYNDLPQGTGTVLCSVIICNTPCPSWTATAPTVVIALPSGTYNGVSYSSGKYFTVHEWIMPSIQSYTWDGVTRETIEVAIKCEAGKVWGYNTATIPSWITIDIGHYIGDPEFGEPVVWESLISSPSLWVNDIIVRLFPSDPISSLRSGVLDLQIDSTTLYSMPLTQYQARSMPVVTVSAIGFVINDAVGSVALGSTALSYSFSPVRSGLTSFVLRKNGVRVLGTSFDDTLETGIPYSGGYTLAQAATYDDVYVIELSIP